MLIKLKNLMRIVIASSLGIWLGNTIWVWIDFRRNPGIYAMQSAPWYTQIIANSVVAAIILSIEIVMYFIILHYIKKRKS